MNTPAPLLFRSGFDVPADLVEAVIDALDEAAESIAAFEIDPDVEGGPWRIELVHRRPIAEDGLQAKLFDVARACGLDLERLDSAPLPRTDWATTNTLQFPPQRIGRFWIHGSHSTEARPAATAPIHIDAGLAFGSGEHATTRGCLKAVDALARTRRFRRVLDLGCGSGILAIAAARCWPAEVIAADNDPIAVAVAEANLALNPVRGRVRTVVAEGYRHPLIARMQPFDLVLANILADPLCELAFDLARHLAPGGHAVLSGLLERQEDEVIAAHRMAGLHLRARHAIPPWSTLVMTRPRGRPQPRPRAKERAIR